MVRRNQQERGARVRKDPFPGAPISDHSGISAGLAVALVGFRCVYLSSRGELEIISGWKSSNFPEWFPEPGYIDIPYDDIQIM